MKLNQQLLRARRMELGLTSREVARESNVSQRLIKRLEETGDVAVLHVATLATILNTLSLDLFDALDHPQTPTSSDNLVAAIGGLLHERKRIMTPYEIAAALGVTLDQIEPAVQALDAQLRPAGLRLHCTSKGFSIVSIVRPNLGSQSSKERLHYLSNLNSGDLALLYRALTERVPAKTVAATVHSTISLRKLEGAGLAWVNDHRLCLTELARTALEG
jgi:transcriptional regulator with XRE-family HTH domain